MANTRIKALIGFSDGVISMGVGEIRDVEASKATDFINGGLAEAYTDPIEPSGDINITENGTYDVTAKASAVVAVPQPTGSQTITSNGTYDVTEKANVTVNVGLYTVAYDVNGGTGSIASENVVAGNSVTLNNGSSITPPSEKVFAGWGTSESATEAVESPYTPTENTILYAIYNNAE